MRSRSRKWKSRELTPEEYDDMLQDKLVGTLSLSDGTSPYAVQLEYLYHNGALYMATSLEGRKVDYLKKNNRAVFTVFQDRCSHPEMIQKKMRCRSVLAEGRVETLLIKKVPTHKGGVYPFRLLKFTIEKRGSWQCDRKRCNQVAGLDTRKFILEWLQEDLYADQEK